MDNRKIAVLVVEDEPLLRLDIAQELADHGLEVIEAANALEALRILQEKAVHVVFTDVDMPGGVDGLELARIVRERYPPIHLVVTSGHRLVTERDLPVQAKFIPKPYSPEQIIETIANVARSG